jgi:paraquat-inducible protein B
MKQLATDGAQVPGPAPVKTRRFSVSLVWIVPIVAVLVGISLVVHSILQEGPTITITFKTGDGLTANKTEVKYRNVVIGQVSDVELSNDQKSVNATVKLAKQAESFTREDSKFWVVRPRIGAGGVSGIDTLLSGITSAPISARPMPGRKISRAWKTRHPSPTASPASASPCIPRTWGRWISALRCTTARSRSVRSWPMPWILTARGEHRPVHPRPQ